MEETSAGCCVTVFYVLSVVVVGTVVTRERRDVWATLACSAANCIRAYVYKQKGKLQSKRNKRVVLSHKNLEVPAAVNNGHQAPILIARREFVPPSSSNPGAFLTFTAEVGII